MSRPGPTFLLAIRERVSRFIKGLSYGHTFSMALELETDSLLQQVMEISIRLECILGECMEDNEAKSS